MDEFLFPDIPEASVLSVFLPCSRARKEKVWSARVELTVRVQRVRSEDQCSTTAGEHEFNESDLRKMT